jgi:cell division protein FtsI/penicillin-binding protein 2
MKKNYLGRWHTSYQRPRRCNSELHCLGLLPSSLPDIVIVVVVKDGGGGGGGGGPGGVIVACTSH